MELAVSSHEVGPEKTLFLRTCEMRFSSSVKQTRSGHLSCIWGITRRSEKGE